MELKIDEKTLMEMLEGKIPIDSHTLNCISFCNNSTYSFDKLNLSKIKKLPFHAKHNDDFQFKTISKASFIHELTTREHGVHWSNKERNNVSFFCSEELSSIFKLRKKYSIKHITDIKIEKLNKKTKDELLINFKNIKLKKLQIYNLKLNGLDNFLLKITYPKKEILKLSKILYAVIPDNISYKLLKENIIKISPDEVLFRGEILDLSKKVLTGKTPVTQSVLYYLALNHENYDLTKLDTSQITNFSNLFYKSTFNQDISNWNVSNGEDFGWMFGYNKYFNQNISKWNVSNGKRFKCMFYKAEIFNYNISAWDLNSATTMMNMLDGMKLFNQDLTNLKINIDNFRMEHDIEIITEPYNTIKLPIELFIFNHISSYKKRTNISFEDKNNKIMKKNISGVLSDLECFHLNYIENKKLVPRLTNIMNIGSKLIESIEIKVDISKNQFYRLYFNGILKELDKKTTIVTIKKLIKIGKIYYKLTEEEYQSLKESNLFN